MLQTKHRKASHKTIIPRRKHMPYSKSSKKKESETNPFWTLLSGILIFIVIICTIAYNLHSHSDSGIALVNSNIKNKIETELNPYIPGTDIIYVSIATLGDFACPMTVNDLFTKAKHPNNIFVGIYQQNEGEDIDCLAMLRYCTDTDTNTHPSLGDISVLCRFKHNIFIDRTDVVHGAKGPVYGRYMSMKLVPKNEKIDFVCMIDSHTLFRVHWDQFTLQMFYSITPDYNRSVLTHYPLGAGKLQQRIDSKSKHSYHICGSIYEGAPNYMIRNANGCFAKNAVKPVRVPFFAGGFSFTTTHFWAQIPLDPYLLYIFNGEEFDISTRGWTHGWDFYSPPMDIVGHYYDKGPKRRSPFVTQNKDSQILRDKSEKRLNYLWGLWDVRYPNERGLTVDEIANKAELRDLEKYGLGNKRTLAQYWKYAGVDPIHKNITVFKEAMYAKGGLAYVPY